MVNFNQIIKIQYKPTVYMGGDNSEAIVALGNLDDNMFTIKLLDSSNNKLVSKKYLKKSDTKLINEVLLNGSWQDKDCIVENIDLSHLEYMDAMDEIEDKFREVSSICKK